ncbi:protein fantom [Erpetoichthys calabaricus]|uniref:protein fantom n=1 Tax=Erpetoichthys calabaricus TaxID=27687 RepID=UPI002234323B|nr:protein fantom [Erpetoichthys calabaricus]
MKTDLRTRQRVSKVSRDHLEDQFLRLHEENHLLKQYARQQEDKMKRMATKLLRLTSDRQRGDATGRQSVRDTELEDLVEDLQNQVRTLERHQDTLQNKLSVAYQQLQVQGSRHSPYCQVPARVNTGLHGSRDPKLRKGPRVQNTDIEVRRPTKTAPPRLGTNTLDEMQAEVEQLYSRLRSTLTESQHSKMAELETAAEYVKQCLKSKEMQMEEILQELRKQHADKHRETIRDNVDLIRLQKKLSDKSAALLIAEEKLAALQESYETQLEESQKSLKESCGSLLGKVQELTDALREEKEKNLSLESQLKVATISHQVLDELQAQVSNLEMEKSLLKEDYDRLLDSALNADNTRNRKEAEEQLRAENLRLENAIQEELSEKCKVLEEMKLQRGAHEALIQKHSSLEQEALRLKEDVSSLQQKITFITSECDMSVEALSETLMQIKSFRLQRANERLDFLQKDDDDQGSEPAAVARTLRDLQVSHAETVLELEKTRDMLILQHKINKDYQLELQTVMRKAEDDKEDFERRLEQNAHLLNIRAQRIGTLEAQLKDIAYGTRCYKSKSHQRSGETCDEDNITLRHGENLLEVYIGGAYFTPEALRILEDRDATTFCSLAFYDFETQITPVVRGMQPVYNFTSQYPVVLDDFFLQYLRTASPRLEIHVANGTSFHTLGVCQIPFPEVLEKAMERVYGKASIIGPRGETFGVLEYWARLHIPIEETTRLHQKRMTALGYLSANAQQRGRQGAPTLPASLIDTQMHNQLEVTVVGCSGLKSRWPGLVPDAYVIYKFYDIPDHDSLIIPCSEDPVFNDTASFDVPVTFDLQRYLRFETLWIYVFDDADPETAAYLGKAGVPLISLAQGKPVKGNFALQGLEGQPAGSIQVALRWKFPYTPPENLTKWPAGDQSKPREEFVPLTERVPVAKPRTKLASQTIQVTPTMNKVDSGQVPPPKTSLQAPQSSHPPHGFSRRRKKLCVSAPSDTVEASRTEELKADPVQIQEQEVPREEPAEQSKEVKMMEEMELQDVEEEDSTLNGVQTVTEMNEDGQVLEEVVSIADSSDSQTSDSDAVVIPKPVLPTKMQSERLRVEILSLTIVPESRVALDEEIQQLYVEYRIFGVPLETTETPISLRKPTQGEEIHYNFTRVIYVDKAENFAVRQYLYTMLEGKDPNKGRLKFTVVSEPVEEEHEECQDVGYAYLDLKAVLLSGSDVVEQQLDVVNAEDDKDVIGKLKVSLEAAQAFCHIYWEFKKTEEVSEDNNDNE